jgi:hypothetical protein
MISIEYVSRQPPAYEIPESIDFFKTIIAGFPSGDKRLTFVQMEALTGWSARDEWDFEYLGMTNHPFIKANYPHHGKYRLLLLCCTTQIPTASCLRSQNYAYSKFTHI